MCLIGKKATIGAPILLVLLYALLFGAFYQTQLTALAEEFTRSFKAQNMDEIESENIFGLIGRLEAVVSSMHFMCLRASRDTVPFYNRAVSVSCRAGSFSRQVSVSSHSGSIQIHGVIRAGKDFETVSLFMSLLFVLSILVTSALLYRIKHIQVQGELELAQLAQQVAHDIRSPLSALKVGLEAIGEKPEDAIGLISTSIHRISLIADDLLDRRGRENPYCQIGRVVRQSVSEINAVWKDKREPDIRMQIADDLWAQCPAGVLSRVLCNIMGNAMEALPISGGNIELRAWLEDETCIIQISDTGHGMTPAQLRRAGKREFTQKLFGHGLGLSGGLKAMRKYGGDLSIKSVEGKGTQVILRIPRKAIRSMDT